MLLTAEETIGAAGVASYVQETSKKKNRLKQNCTYVYISIHVHIFIQSGEFTYQ